LVADEVLKLHFDGFVGIVPLSSTVHELVHSGKIKIPSVSMYGDWRIYFEEYSSWMDDHEKAAIEEAIGMEILESNNEELKVIEYLPKKMEE